MGGCLCPWESSIPALLEARKSDSISLSLSATHPQCPRCQTAALPSSPGWPCCDGSVEAPASKAWLPLPLAEAKEGPAKVGEGGCEAIGSSVVRLHLLFC